MIGARAGRVQSEFSLSLCSPTDLFRSLILPPRPHRLRRRRRPLPPPHSPSRRRSPMPSESTTSPHELHPQDQQQAQIKVCSSCHCPLSTDSANTPFLLQDHQDSNDTSIVCGPCRARLLAIRTTDTPVPTREGFIFAEVERTLLRRAASLQDGDNEADERHPVSNNRPIHSPDDEPSLDADMDVEASLQSLQALPSLSAAFESQNLHCRSPPSAAPPPLSCSTAPSPIPPLVAPMKSQPVYSSLVSSHSPRPPISSSSVASSSRYRPLDHPTSAPDPYVDITRLRVRSQGHHCLYPGATFQGTQRSGRNSYDVNVTIVVSSIWFLHVKSAC